MANFVHVSNGVTNGRNVNVAVNHLREGFNILSSLNGTRNAAIGEGQAKMMSVFGTATEAEAQILSDRWGALIAAYLDTGNAEFAKIRDFVNETIDGTP